MAVTTYAELKTAIGDWLDRSDLSSYLGDFVTFAEGYLNRELMHRNMVTTTDLTPSSNVCTLPTDYLHYIRVVEKASVRRSLTYISPDVADQRYADRSSGIANNFTIIGNSLTAYPLSTNDIELTYRQKIPALADDNTSNWLLVASPELYLRAAQFQALMFINETSSPRFQTVAALTERLIANLNDESNLSLHYQAGLQMRGATP
jgi:hypothetical protein